MMRLTKRQRRHKKRQQKVRAQVRKITNDLHAALMGRVLTALDQETKDFMKDFLMQRIKEMEPSHFIEIDEVESDGSSIKMDVRGRALDMPFFEDEYANALKYGGEKLMKELNKS